MKINDFEILTRGTELQKRAVADYSAVLNGIDDKTLSELIISQLNEEIAILQRLRAFGETEKENRTEIPASEEEISAVVNKFSSD